jgi:hypothetical protein
MLSENKRKSIKINFLITIKLLKIRAKPLFFFTDIGTADYLARFLQWL